MLALIAGLGFAAYKNADRIEHLFAPATPSSVSAPADIQAPANIATQTPVNIPASGTSSAVRYVHREGSVLREEPKASSKTLKKESKGSQLVLEQEGGGWSKVADGNITGWMRTSVLGERPPQ